MDRAHSFILGVASALTLAGATDEALAQSASTPVEIHGFVSQGAMWTTDNNYLTRSEHGSFELTEAGINFTSQPTDRLRIGLQLFAHDLGPVGNYDAKLDWFYLDYRWQDWLGIRAGRVKVPFGLYNDTSDIDAARVPILLPQSVYPLSNRDFLLAQSGVEIYGWRDLQEAGAIDYRIYAGTVFLDIRDAADSPALRLDDLRTPYIVGGRLLWETPLLGLRVGGSVQALRLDADLAVQDMPVTVKIPAVLAIGSLEYLVEDLLFAAEYSRWFVGTESSNEALFPSAADVTSERAYAMASYRASPWLQPGLYYSLLFPDVRDRTGRASNQHDVAATLRLDIDSNWMMKLEAHYMHGTAGLSSALNDGLPLARLSRDWAVVLAKATASF
jgi:hypothetical protein